MTSATPTPLDDADITRLQTLLDGVPAPLQPLDVVALDGYLCGVLLQPQRVPAEQWLRFVTDVDGQPAPDKPALHELQALAMRRHAEIDRAIEARDWLDPWIFDIGDELDDDDDVQTDAGPDAERDVERDVGRHAEAYTDGDTDGGTDGDTDGDDAASPGASDSVLPWVAGFAAAMDAFPGLMALDEPALVEPLALLYLHFDAEDLEDADALLEVIATLEPPADLAEAVQDIVRALMLMADVTRPRRTLPLRRPAGRSGPARRPKR